MDDLTNKHSETKGGSRDENRFPFVQAWLIFILSCLFYFYQFILQVSPDAIGPDLAVDFSVTSHRLGMLSAAFFLSYTVMQIPVGVLLDRYGPHRLLTVASIICALSSISFAFAPYLIVASVSRLAMGLGAAVVFIGSLKLISTWFSMSRFTLMIGIFSTVGMLGAIAGQAPLSLLIAHFGWRSTMFALGVFGFVLALLILLLIKNSPVKNIKLQKKPLAVFKKELAIVFKNKQLWLVAVYTGILSIPCIAFSSLYGIPFLMAKYPVDMLTAARMVSLILLGIGIGSPVWGVISDHMKRRLPPLIIAAVGSPLLLLFIVYIPVADLATTKMLLFAFGFISAASLSAFTIASEVNKHANIATAMAVVNTFDTLGGTLALPLLGRLLDHFWQGIMNHGARIYGLTDYKITLSFLLVIVASAMFLLPFIKETHAKSID
jgi:MFS family permease